MEMIQSVCQYLDGFWINDTIVGIEALADFAAKIATATNNVKIDVATSYNKYIFDVNQDNALVLQSQKVCQRQ